MRRGANALRRALVSWENTFLNGVIPIERRTCYSKVELTIDTRVGVAIRLSSPTSFHQHQTQTSIA